MDYQLDKALKQDVLLLCFSFCFAVLFLYKSIFNGPDTYPFFYSIFALFRFFPLSSALCHSHFSISIPILLCLFYFIGFCSILFCSVLFCTVPYYPLWFVSFPYVSVPLQQLFPSFFLFIFSHFILGQFSLVHSSPALFVFYPSLSCTTPLVRLNTLDLFCPAAHPSGADRPECLHSLVCVI